MVLLIDFFDLDIKNSGRDVKEPLMCQRFQLPGDGVPKSVAISD